MAGKTFGGHNVWVTHGESLYGPKETCLPPAEATADIITVKTSIIIKVIYDLIKQSPSLSTRIYP